MATQTVAQRPHVVQFPQSEPATEQISQTELALLLSLRGRLKQLQTDFAAEEDSLKTRLAAGAIVEPGRQTVTEQHKFTYAYEDWGCLVCGTKEQPHSSLWMCYPSYRRTSSRLQNSIRRHAPDADQPQPTFTDTVKLARTALAPSIETLAKNRKGK